MKTKNKIYNIFVPIIFIILSNVFFLQFKIGEKFIYFWDIAGYWINSMDFSDLIFLDFKGAMIKLYNSILNDNYTLLPSLFFVPFFHFISKSNLMFVLISFNLFGLSFIFCIYTFLNKHFSCENIYVKSIILFILFSFTTLLTPIMGGFLDCVGLSFIAILLLHVQSFNFEIINIKKSLITTVLILLICFLRRWYMYFIISFFICYFISIVINKLLFEDKTKNTKIILIEILNIFINFFISGIVWLFILFVFFKQFLINSVFNNYSFAYSAYDFGGIKYNLDFLLSQVGFFILILFIIGVILCFIYEKNKTFAFFFLLQCFFILILFTQTQSLGIQHIYLFVPAMIYFICGGIIICFKKLNYNLFKKISVVVIFLFAINFINCYFNHNIKVIKILEPVLSQKKLYKRNRTDIKEINELVDYINEINLGYKYSYVLSSSDILNTDILSNSKLPNKKNAIKNLLYTKDVDKRDGFPFSFYVADIIIITDPVGYHLNPKDQQIVGILANNILNGLAKDSLKLVKTFNLSNNVIAKVYVKEKPYSHEFINNIDNEFKKSYPDHSFINNTKSIFSYIYNLDLEKDKNFFAYNYNDMALELGMEQASFYLNCENNFNNLSFTTISNYEKDTKKKIIITNDKDEIILENEIKNGDYKYNINVNDCTFIKFTFVSENNGVDNIYLSFKDTVIN